MADPMDTISPASYRLQAAEEGYIGIRPGPLDPGQDSIIGDPPGGCSSDHLPLPHRHYVTVMNKDVEDAKYVDGLYRGNLGPYLV